MEQPPPIFEPQSPATAPPGMSLMARVLNIFVTPGDVFDTVKHSRTSTANWLVPTLIYGLIAAVGAVLILSQPAIVQKMHEAQAKGFDDQVQSGKITREQADQRLAAAEKFSGPVAKVFMSVGAFVVCFIELFWWAFLLWLIGRVCLKSPLNFMKVVEVAGLASIIAALESLLKLLLIVNTSNPMASPSLAMLLKTSAPQNIWFVLSSLVNPILFWLLGVRAIGLARLSGTSVARAALWVCIVWLVLMAIVVGISIAVMAVFGKAA